MKFDLDQKNDSDDDDIIDLTEIIEQGKPTGSAASDADMTAALSDLGNSSSAVPDLSAMGDVDLDALLAQMDSDGGFSHLEEATPPPAPQASVAAQDSQANDLPDMSDVDALLAEIDMPPQPEATPAPVAQQSPNAPDDIDSMLDGMFDEPVAPAAPQAKTAPAPDASDELDALFEGMLDDAPPSPVTSAPTHDTSLDDMDAILNDVLGEEPFSAADVAASLVPGPKKGNDVSFEKVAQAVATPQPPKAKPMAEPDFNDLDKDLDAILNSANTSPTPSLDDDLDAILGASEKEMQLSPEADLFAPVQNNNVSAKAAQRPVQERRVAEKVQSFEVPASSVAALNTQQNNKLLEDIEQRVHLLEENTALRFQDLENQIGLAASGDESQIQQLQENLASQEQKIAQIEAQSQNAYDAQEQDTALQHVVDTHAKALEDYEEKWQVITEKMVTYENSLEAISQQEPASSGPDEATQEQLQQLQASFAAQEEKIMQLEAKDLASSQDEATQEQLQQLQANFAAQEEKIMQLEAKDLASSQDEATQEQLQQLQANFAAQEEKIMQLEAKDFASSQEAQNVHAELRKTLEEHTTQFAAYDSKLEAMASAAQEDTSKADESTLLQDMVEKVQQLETATTEASERESTMKDIVAAQITKLEGSVQAAVQSLSEQTSLKDVEENYAQLRKELEEAQQREQALQAKLDALEGIKQEQNSTIEQLQASVSHLEERLKASEENLQVNLEKMAAAAAAKVLREEIMALLSEGATS